jgi:hypothetical protein
MLQPPRSGLRRLSWSCAVLRGHKRARLGCVWVDTRPVRRFHALQALSSRAVLQPKLQAALHGLPLSFRARSPGPHAVPPVARHVRRRFLSWTSLALRHIPGRRIRLPPADPSADACRVRGLTTPCATSTTGPADASSAPERPWASPFKVFPSSRSVPLSEPVPSCRCPQRRASPEGSAHCMVGFRALFP